MQFSRSMFPGPAQLSIACSTVSSYVTMQPEIPTDTAKFLLCFPMASIIVRKWYIYNCIVFSEVELSGSLCGRYSRWETGYFPAVAAHRVSSIVNGKWGMTSWRQAISELWPFTPQFQTSPCQEPSGQLNRQRTNFQDFICSHVVTSGLKIASVTVHSFSDVFPLLKDSRRTRCTILRGAGVYL